MYVNAPSLGNSRLLPSLGTVGRDAEDADAECDAGAFDMFTVGALGL